MDAFICNHGQNYSDEHIKYKECSTICKISSENPSPLPGTMLVNTRDMTVSLLTFETATLYQGGEDANIL